MNSVPNNDAIPRTPRRHLPSKSEGCLSHLFHANTLWRLARGCMFVCTCTYTHMKGGRGVHVNGHINAQAKDKVLNLIWLVHTKYKLIDQVGIFPPKLGRRYRTFFLYIYLPHYTKWKRYAYNHIQLLPVELHTHLVCRWYEIPSHVDTDLNYSKDTL